MVRAVMEKFGGGGGGQAENAAASGVRTPIGSFLPASYVRARARLRADILSLVLFALVMGGVVAAFMVTQRRWDAVRTEQRAVDLLFEQQATRIAQLEELKSSRTEMLGKAELAVALVERVPRSTLIEEFVSTLPPGVTLIELELESKRIASSASSGSSSKKVKSLKGSSSSKKKKSEPKPEPVRYSQSLNLVGVSSSNDAIADYMTALKSSPVLERVELEYISETKMDDTELRRFAMTARVRAGYDARGELLDALAHVEALDGEGP